MNDKKTNVEILNELGILEDISEAAGYVSNDAINRMDANQIVEKYSQWHLGYGSWWVEMKNIYDKLNER